MKDLATLTVETRTTVTGGDGSSTLVASSVIKLDGDNTAIVPVQTVDGQVVINSVLYDVHMQNVNAAIAYRAQMLESRVGLLRPRTG